MNILSTLTFVPASAESTYRLSLHRPLETSARLSWLAPVDRCLLGRIESTQVAQTGMLAARMMLLVRFRIGGSVAYFCCSIPLNPQPHCERPIPERHKRFESSFFLVGAFSETNPRINAVRRRTLAICHNRNLF
jgi:hypothetical protein